MPQSRQASVLLFIILHRLPIVELCSCFNISACWGVCVTIIILREINKSYIKSWILWNILSLLDSSGLFAFWQALKNECCCNQIWNNDIWNCSNQLWTIRQIWNCCNQMWIKRQIWKFGRSENGSENRNWCIAIDEHRSSEVEFPGDITFSYSPDCQLCISNCETWSARESVSFL